MTSPALGAFNKPGGLVGSALPAQHLRPVAHEDLEQRKGPMAAVALLLSSKLAHYSPFLSKIFHTS